MKYRLKDPARVEMLDPLGERFRLRVKAGTHEPRSEREEVAFEHLVSIGIAERVKAPRQAKPAPTSKPKEA